MNFEKADDMHHGASKKIFQHAEVLRSKLTPAEEKLWNELSNKKVDGYKFRKQHPLNMFIADFYCH